MKKLHLYIGGMTCAGCENTLERAVSAVEGVLTVKADVKKGEMWAEFAPPCDELLIRSAIENAGYEVLEKPRRNWNGVYMLVILGGLFVIARALGITELFQIFPTVGSARVGYAALFVIGLMTSVHCVAMCGGINLTQSMTGGAAHPVRQSALYNLGRLTSYTLIGGVLGVVGEAASVTLRVRGLIGLVAGVAMLLMGINLLGQSGFLRRFSFELPRFLTQRLAALQKHGPYAIGLVNGLMPCGPLQSMQLYAIASGGLIAGALSMFFFCLGTIPLVLLLGATAGKLQMSWKRQMLRLSAALLVILGFFMVQNNLALVGVSVSASLPGAGSFAQAAVVEGDAQHITTRLKPGGYDNIQVKAGIPVVWTITADKSSLNGCNNALVLPAFNQQIRLSEGETVISFLPEKAGVYTYSCWMGMLKNTITVTG